MSRSVVAFAGLMGLAVGVFSLVYFETGLSKPVVFAFILGVSTPLLIKYATPLLLPTILDQSGQQQDHQGRLYGLEHGLLHINLPPGSMWMNLGFWKDSPSSFAKACSALLDEILLTAGVVKKKYGTVRIQRPISIVDVGFGCGDQSLYLMSLASGSFEKDTRDRDHDAQDRPVLSYVGITMNKQQFLYARDRFANAGLLSSDTNTNFSVFQADAADPQNWQPELAQAIARLGVLSAQQNCETWLLGLDSLYHFFPSRRPILVHAKQQLQASLMAFDLAFPDEGHRSFIDKIFLRLFCAMTSIPYKNLVTVTEYSQQLRSVGYTDIVMRDISEHVFAPLVQYLDSQDTALQVLGKSLGKFRVAGWVFAWLARSGLIRGYIVVARHPRAPSSQSRGSANIY